MAGEKAESQISAIEPSGRDLLLMGEEMEFYIQYEGLVPSQNTSDKENKRFETHRIRRHFHPQLTRMWDCRLGQLANLPPRGDPSRIEQRKRYLDEASERCTTKEVREETEFRFLPIVSTLENLVCALDITLYRHIEPGAIIGEGGDLDNRIKCLFDAMSMPQYASQLTNLTPEQSEHPFFCLLQDDSLITAYSIKTLQLWTTPASKEEQEDDSYFKVSVKVKISRTKFAGWGIAALPDV